MKKFTKLLSVIFLAAALVWPVYGSAEEPVSAVRSMDEKRITLDLKGMDIVEVIKMLSIKGDLNIVIGANVQGRVTMFLNNVPVRDAFEIILQADNLACDTRGEIIYVMTEREYELLYGKRYSDQRVARIIPLKYINAAELTKTLAQIKTKLGSIIADEGSNTIVILDTPEAVRQAENLIENADRPSDTRIININYADAKALQDKLQDVLTKGVGKIQMDSRTNKLAVTDLSNNIPRIEKIIKEFDEKPMQVLIDAKIIQLRPSKKFFSGIDWDYWIEKYFRVQGTFPIPSPSGIADRIKLGTVGIADPAEKGDYKSVIQFLETFGDTKILSSPRILALNNQEAKILVGTKEVYITSTVSELGQSAVTAQQVNFVDVGVKLYVTPTINKEGFVILKIRPEVSSSERQTIKTEDKETEVPIVTTSEAETTVIVRDGVNVIIGGLKGSTRINERKGVPVLGRIPLLGILFQSRDDEWSKNELIIFLTPHIISGENAYLEPADQLPVDISELEGPDADVLKGALSEKKSKRKKQSRYEVEYVKTEEINEDEYFSHVKNRVIENLVIPNDAGKYLKYGDKTMVSFTLLTGGNLASKPRIEGSTNKYFDGLAVTAVEKAAPFQPFPLSMEKSRGKFEIELVYEPRPERKK